MTEGRLQREFRISAFLRTEARREETIKERSLLYSKETSPEQRALFGLTARWSLSYWWWYILPIEKDNIKTLHHIMLISCSGIECEVREDCRSRQ